LRLEHEDAEVLVATRLVAGRAHDLLVVVAEADEWTLVRMKGELEPILEQAMELAFARADRPELYDRTRAARGLAPGEPDHSEPETELSSQE
jgi:hypothetical protein